jgi:dihydroxyacetone kinase-like protein
MKKFINNPDNLVEELLEGYVQAYPNKVKLVGDNLVARVETKPAGKVGLVSLGGSGHEPGHIGYVGFGLLDICVPGDIFAAPSPQRCLEAFKMADQGAGVLFVVGNHTSDLLSARMAMEMAQSEGLNVKMVLNHEDIASGTREKPEERRGLVGFLPIYKVAGAGAEQGRDLAEIHRLAEDFSRNMCTLAVALSPATHPITGETLFEIDDDEMEIGMGSHGEAGIARMKLKSANQTADIMLEQLMADLELKAGEKILAILSGAGATTLMELFIIFRRMGRVLSEKGLTIARSLVDEIITTQEQAGFQMFLARMNTELLSLWDEPCDSPYLTMR